MKKPDPRDLQAIGIDFGGTSVKIGALSDILTDGGAEPIVLETAAYGSVDDLITRISPVLFWKIEFSTVALPGI